MAPTISDRNNTPFELTNELNISTTAINRIDEILVRSNHEHISVRLFQMTIQLQHALLSWLGHVL
jgi:hypothetical protein